MKEELKVIQQRKEHHYYFIHNTIVVAIVAAVRTSRENTSVFIRYSCLKEKKGTESEDRKLKKMSEDYCKHSSFCHKTVHMGFKATNCASSLGFLPCTTSSQPPLAII